jgi:carbonic anhydrase
MYLPQALTFLAILSSASAASGVYDYDHIDLWGDIVDPDGKTNYCKPATDGSTGLKNSPIALETGSCTKYANYDMASPQGSCTLDDMNFYVTNNGVKMDFGTSGCSPLSFKIPVDEITQTYTHAQTHIHLSSEHTIDGHFYAAELHMVHATADANPENPYSVLGTMIKPGSPVNNPQFERFIAKWVEWAQANVCENCFDYENFADDVVDIDLYENMRGKDFYHYDGGLTTPLCDEAVWWNFNTEPWLISPRQYQIMTDLVLATRKVNDDNMCKTLTVASKSGSTSRPPQPLNGRTVQKICALS